MASVQGLDKCRENRGIFYTLLFAWTFTESTPKVFKVTVSEEL